MTQKQEIKQHLLKGLPLTPKGALQMFGSFRLAAVIHKLKGEGMEIETKLIDNEGENRYAKYRIIKS